MKFPPTQFPSKGVIAKFANAAGLTVQSTGSYPTTHTITWSQHQGCAEAAERVQRALHELGYGVKLQQHYSNAYGKGSLQLFLPLFLDAAIRTGLAAAIAEARADEEHFISYMHALVLGDSPTRRDVKFVLGMRKSAPGFGSANMFSAMTSVHRHIVKATWEAYENHVVMGRRSAAAGARTTWR